MTGPEDPRPGGDWQAFLAARARFYDTVRPEAMREPRAATSCPDAVPEEWSEADRSHGPRDHEAL